ncbi:MAG TPA: hypothetical protein PL193_07575 [Xanthobacteraceae bacterium]|nr:hypothetical protein [Xanthobacteraceae bacterium]
MHDAAAGLQWADRYLQIPFKDFGRDFNGADCFGLYALILANEAQVRVREVGVSVGRSPRAVMAQVAVEIASGRWHRVEHPRRFDLVQMFAYAAGHRSADLHVGCATGPASVIHTERPHGVKHESLADEFVQARVVAFWRPKGLQHETR